MSLAEIHDAIPHRDPFLLVDEIVERDEARIVCRKTFRGEEYFCQATIPNYPLVPGVLLCEAAMQAARSCSLVSSMPEHKACPSPRG